MHKLLELAAKVEQLAGPDREVDARIAVAIKFGARGLLADDHEYLSFPRKDDSCSAGTYWFHCRSGMSLRTAPAYTASLDAAMTLVPADTTDEVTFWKVGNDGEGGDPSLFKATVLIVTGFTSKTFQTVADTAPIALCAAALRAIAQKEADYADPRPRLTDDERASA